MSLRTRVLAAVAVVGVVLGLAMFVITRSTQADLLRQVDAQLTGAIGPVRSYGFQPDGGPGRATEQRLTSLYVGYLAGGEVRTLVAPSLRELPLPRIDADDVVAGARSGEAFTVSSTEAGPRYRALAYTDLRARAVIVLGLPIDAVDQAVARLVALQILGAAAILAALGLVAWWVIRLGVRPLDRMSEVASAIAAGDLTRRVPEGNPDTEAGQLGSALNRMLGQIEAAFEERNESQERLRRFVADASHELRTPVATVRGYAELHRTGGLAGPGQLDDALRRIEEEAVRMGGLIEDLLLLARLDQRRPLDMGPVDLTSIAEDAANDARVLGPRHRVSVSSTGPVTVSGDEARLRQVASNLVGNAVVHTPAGTQVDITISSQSGRGRLEVADTGPGMSDEQAERAFERFYRADPARARDSGGSGLGLSIVRAIVDAHQGEIDLTSRPGEGTTVVVALPLHGV